MCRGRAWRDPSAVRSRARRVEARRARQTRLRSGTDPDREILHRAAAIAAYHSKARTAGVVAVSGTRVRDVSKPRGAKAGTVQIRHEQVFKVRPARGDLAGESGHASA